MALDLNNGFWLLPSRRRPHNLRRFFTAFAAMQSQSPGLVFVQRDEYAELKSQYESLMLPKAWQMVLTDGDSQGDKLREQQSLFHNAAWVGLIGDDQEPVTIEWDRLLVSRLNGWNLVTCLDDWVVNKSTKWGQPNRMAGTLLFSGDLYRAIGYIFPPKIHHVYLDDIFEELATRVDFWEICRDVMILHHHAQRDPARADSTDALAYGNNNSFCQIDLGPWQDWRTGDINGCVARIMELKKQYGVA